MNVLLAIVNILVFGFLSWIALLFKGFHYMPLRNWLAAVGLFLFIFLGTIAVATNVKKTLIKAIILIVGFGFLIIFPSLVVGFEYLSVSLL